MYCVYSIQSQIDPKRYYIGITTDVTRRLEEHNAGKSVYTIKYKPWKLVTYVAFGDRFKAKEFETYLKTGSGRAFCKRHF